ncbi:hypothetical protein llap_6189 [Limosa lapponica baueri]|uniref:Uncharacterized protein n=1 Tax=Limosa lapponica baueri TaxID=1758121 RepID=A0A2I0UBV1_LIMLA|nr:hypothetical protein llap_6189 [Limosa lapponica baueri]
MMIWETALVRLASVPGKRVEPVCGDMEEKLVADSIASEAGDSEAKQCANHQGPTISIQAGLWPVQDNGGESGEQAFIAEQTSYGMENPFDQFGSAVLALSPPNILPTPSLLILPSSWINCVGFVIGKELTTAKVDETIKPADLNQVIVQETKLCEKEVADHFSYKGALCALPELSLPG